MTIILCGQTSVLGETCPGCGGWLSRVQPGGFPSRNGFFCDEDCIADHQEWLARQHLSGHFATRDLLCECAEICKPAGRPTVAERQEYADYLATLVDGREPA